MLEVTKNTQQKKCNGFPKKIGWVTPRKSIRVGSLLHWREPGEQNRSVLNWKFTISNIFDVSFKSKKIAKVKSFSRGTVKSTLVNGSKTFQNYVPF